jgi:tetratricopeptide (TPR) repeat protein
VGVALPDGPDEEFSMADRIKAIFLAALETPIDQRPAYLERTCGSDPEVRRRVEALLRAHEGTDQLLDHPAWRPVAEGDRQATLPMAGPGAADSQPERAGRVHLLGEIARGGMGVVLRGHDPEMGRDLAVKVLLPAHRGNSNLQRRFVSEARLAGQLQHPGIVPVHDVGQLSDGRPFFTMKLIQGRTLADLLAQRPEPGHDLPRFLRYFEAVCQAVGYAHARGVIHRDLKPLNVMVGAFGEVQVMDWGLAKRLEDGTEENPEQPPPLPASLTSTPIPAALTLPGAIVGTPGYLAPEQARGEPGDQRSDVFGLGAILCEILTAAPPFHSAGVLGLLEQTRAADLNDAADRLDRCGADPELVGLANDCLVAKPLGRPANGSAVAARLAEYLAGVQDRLRRAEVGQARAEARAEGERSRRRLAVGLAAALLAVVAMGGGTLLLVQQNQTEQAREQTRRQEAAKSALDRAAELKQQDRWDEALSVLEQAQQRLDERDGQVNEDVRRVVTDLKLVVRLEKVRLRAATMTGRSFSRARADREFEAEFRAADLGSPDEPAEVVAERVRASDVRAALVAALDAWAMTTEDRRRRDWTRGVSRSAAQDSDWDRRLRASWSDPAALAVLAREAPIDRLSPHLLGALAVTLSGRREAVPLLRKAQMRYPGDFWLTFLLAQELAKEEQHAEAAGFYRAALAARPDTPVVLDSLGFELEAQQKVDEAIVCYQRAIAVDPRLAITHNNLGNALVAKGKVDEAITCFRRALAIEAGFAKAHNNLGNALKARGKLDEAVACYQKAIAVNPRFAAAHLNLGIALIARGQRDEAIACIRQAIALDPKDALAHYNLGNALSGKGQVDEAIECFRRAIRLDPSHALAHNNLGLALGGKRHFDEAIACFRKAVALDPKLVHAHSNLGMTLAVMGKLDEAIACLRNTIEIDPNVPEVHCNLGRTLMRRGDFAEALGPFRRGHELGRKRGDWNYPSAAWVRDCERQIEREKKLLDVLGGRSEPANARERIDWAILCVTTRRYAAAARLFGEAFRMEEELARDPKVGNRYRAVRVAALAGVGQGRDAGPLTIEARADLRKQALDWLKADLAAWRSHSDGGLRTQALRHWRADTALAGVRDEEGLGKLPQAERAAWAGLWVEVDRLLKAGQPQGPQ